MAEVIGGAFMSAFFQDLFRRIDCDEIVDFFRGRTQIRILEKLKMTLMSVSVVLEDAEMKQLRNLSIKNWLEGLKDAAEDAENLLDEIFTDALEAKILGAESGSSTVVVVKGFFSSVFDSRARDRKAKMEEILEKLEYFSSQKDILGLSTVVGERVFWRLPSSSVVEVSEVYGREADKDDVKKLLLSDSAETIYVIPMVGMGGIGKTTLAQAIFNDDEVKMEFEVKAWVCVSEEFDICRVTKTVLKAVANNACDTMDLNELQVSLKKTLKEKKFLVVLDDVWNENYEDWDVLKRPFQDGAKGSKMIVTTRIEKVVSVMGSSPTHYLKELSDGDCWELFAKHASGNKDFTQDKKLESIGREIVKKCKRLPLAAKTLGGLLRSTLDFSEWKRVLTTDIWDFRDEESNILPALRVSYYYLPSNLKRCFALCSMFPKGCGFEKEEIIFLWMAENLLSESKGIKRMEDMGNEYFDDLVSRSFFHKTSDNHRSCFHMHDLIVDLAKSISGNGLNLADVKNSRENVTKLRHLTFDDENCASHDWDKFNLLDTTRLRTIFQECNGRYVEILDKVYRDLPLKFKYLRSLSLHGIIELPNSIGDLKHLRYLDLSNSQISKLPETVCGLYSLQTLNLLGCKNLKSLPKYMHRLINLRCLRISEQCIEMPTQMSKLKNLQDLNCFTIGKAAGQRICELKELSDLRGSLCVKNLRKVGNEKDALEAKLMDKKYLKKLLLEWGDEDTDNTVHEKNVIQNLVPSTSIESLEINHYGGTKFPDWVGDCTFNNMVKLKLLNCKYCISLPPLGQLSSLKSLTIKGFPAIETVDHGFYRNSTSSSMNYFQSLERLKLSDMSNWKEWLPMHNGDLVVFPKLEILHITECPKLVGNIPDSFPSLTLLEINECGSMNCSLPNMPALLNLKLYGCHSLATFISIPDSLKKLSIKSCERLKFPFAHAHVSLEDLAIVNSCDSIRCFELNSFTNLTRLVISGLENLKSISLLDGGVGQDMAFLSRLYIESCPNLVSFPVGGFYAPKLTSMAILQCNNLKCLPEKMHTHFPLLGDLRIIRCPEVELFPEADPPSNLIKFYIECCDKLIPPRTNCNLTRLTKLKIFTIIGCSEIRCFPEEGLLPTSITTLGIINLSNLEMLNLNGLKKLTSLKVLHIWSCNKLCTIPVEALPTSLEKLDIGDCLLLVEQTDELKKQISEQLNKVRVTINAVVDPKR